MWSENPGTINGWGELINLGATGGIALSNNLYFKPSSAKPFAVAPSGTPTATYDLGGWQGLGLDSHSLLANPQLVSVDPNSADFSVSTQPVRPSARGSRSPSLKISIAHRGQAPTGMT
jgi:hypothetical protein